MIEILGILTIIFLSLSIFLLFRFIKFEKISKELKEENNSLKEKIVGFKKYIPGQKGIIPNHGLTQTSTKKDFEVTYEVEILEVSENKLKVSAYDYTSTDSFALDPTNRSVIIKFYQNQWVEKKIVEILMDKSDVRDSKIEKILS